MEEKSSATNGVPHVSMNGTESFKPPPLDKSTGSDDDDDVWFEASDKFTSDVITEPSRPLTSKELTQEIEQKHLQSRAELSVSEEDESTAEDFHTPMESLNVDAVLKDLDIGASKAIQGEDTDGASNDDIDVSVMTKDIDASGITCDGDSPMKTGSVDAYELRENINSTSAVKDTGVSVHILDADPFSIVQDVNAPSPTMDTDAPVVTQDNDDSMMTEDITAAIENKDSKVIHDVDNSLAAMVTSAQGVTNFTRRDTTSTQGDAALIQDGFVPSQYVTASSQTTAAAAPMVHSHQREAYLAESLAEELRVQQRMAEARKAEADYVEVHTAALLSNSEAHHIEEEEEEEVRRRLTTMDSGTGMKLETGAVMLNSELVGFGTGLDRNLTTNVTIPGSTSEGECKKELPNQVQIDIVADSKSIEINFAKSLVKELKAQQRMVEACDAETSYIELCTATTMSSNEPISSDSEALIVEVDAHTQVELVTSDEVAIDLQSTEHAQKGVEHHIHTHMVDETEPLLASQEYNTLIVTSQDIESSETTGDEDTPLITHSFVSAHGTPPTFVEYVAAKVVTSDASTNTEPPETHSECTNTFTQEFSTLGVNTDPPPVVKETGCNTMMNCFDVLQRAKEMEELQFLKVEHRIAVTQMNEAKSQRMVAEQLTKIVQSYLAELRQQNLTETTKRLQLENELSDVKVTCFLLSLSHFSPFFSVSHLSRFSPSLSPSLSLST